MLKKIALSLIIAALLYPCISWADDGENASIPELGKSFVFKAQVVRVIKEQEQARANGQKYIQQDVLLKGIEGEMQGKEVTFHGIGDIDVLSSVYVKEGDKVLVLANPTTEGTTEYFITDHVRSGKLLIMTIVFVILILWVGKKQGAKSLIALVLSFVIIMLIIIPLILRSYNPVTVSVFGSVLILAAIIYFTWGWTKKAHVAMFSIIISLIITGLASWFFTTLTKLTGTASEDIMSLLSIGNFVVDFKGLLLAGIILGTVGVLDDVIISQISSVEQLKQANPELGSLELIKRTSKIGIDHLSSMTNTLFLAYAGAALPLLLLFYVKQEPFLSFSQIINNEMIATEIVRTLVGSICLTLAVPISTISAAYLLKGERVKR